MNQSLALTLPGGESFNKDLFGSHPDRLNANVVQDPASLISTLVPIFFIIGGLALFGMLIGGGFTIFTSAGNPEKTKKGTAMITNGVIGFVIMFAAYWIIQLVEFSLGLKLL